MKREYDVARDIQSWIVEMETDPEAFEYVAYILENGDEFGNGSNDVEDGYLDHEYHGTKLYIELIPEADVSFTVEIESGENTAGGTLVKARTVEPGHTVSVDEGDTLWFDLRPCTARWGVDTNP